MSFEWIFLLLMSGVLLLFDVWGIFAVDWGGEVGGAVGRVVAAVEVLSGFFSVDEWGIFAVDWGERWVVVAVEEEWIVFAFDEEGICSCL